MKHFALVFVIALAGCAGDQRNGQQNSFPTLDIPIASNPPAAGVPAVPPTTAVTRAELDAIRSESVASNNANQQSLTGLGVQLGKLGEKVEGVHAELRAELQASVSAQATATLKAQADLRAELSATITQKAELNASAIADLRAEFNNTIKAELKAALQAQAAVQAGIGNRVDQTTAGRDAIQFTPEMAKLLIFVVCGGVAVILALCGVLIVALEMSRRRAEKRATQGPAKPLEDTQFIRLTKD